MPIKRCHKTQQLSSCFCFTPRRQCRACSISAQIYSLDLLPQSARLKLICLEFDIGYRDVVHYDRQTVNRAGRSRRRLNVSACIPAISETESIDAWPLILTDWLQKLARTDSIRTPSSGEPNAGRRQTVRSHSFAIARFFYFSATIWWLITTICHRSWSLPRFTT